MHRNHRTQPVDGKIDLVCFQNLVNSSSQVSCFFFQSLENFSVVVQGLQHRQSGSHGQRISRQSSCLIHRPQWRQIIHDFVSGRKSAHRQTATNHFSEANNIGIDVQQFLCPTSGKTESRHYLIKNQEDSVGCTQLAQAFQKTFIRRNAAHVPGNRFHDDGRDFVFIGFDQSRNIIQVIVFGQQSIFGRSGSHAGTVWRTKSNGSTSGLNQERIGMPVITTGKLDYFVSFGKSASQTNGTHASFGSRIHEPDFVDVGNHRNGQSGDLGFQFGRHSKGSSRFGFFGHGINNGLEGVT